MLPLWRFSVLKSVGIRKAPFGAFPLSLLPSFHDFLETVVPQPIGNLVITKPKSIVDFRFAQPIRVLQYFLFYYSLYIFRDIKRITLYPNKVEIYTTSQIFNSYFFVEFSTIWNGSKMWGKFFPYTEKIGELSYLYIKSSIKEKAGELPA